MHPPLACRVAERFESSVAESHPGRIKRRLPKVKRVVPVPGTLLPCRTDDQVVRIVAVNGTHRLPDALAPLINVRSGTDGDKPTPNVTKCVVYSHFT